MLTVVKAVLREVACFVIAAVLAVCFVEAVMWWLA